MGLEDIPENAEILPLPSEEKEPKGPTDVPPGVVVPEDDTLLQKQPLPPSEVTDGELYEEPTEENLVTQEVHSIWPLLLGIATLALLAGAAITYFALEAYPSQHKPKQQTTVASDKQKSQVLLDRGLEAHTKNASLRNNTIKARIDSAKDSITWVTNFPTDRPILQALQEKKKKDKLVVVVIIGKNASEKDAELAQRMGLTVTRAPIQLEDPQSMLIIDFQKVLDTSRSRILWETIEPNILQQIKQWVKDDLLQDAQPLTQ